MIFSPILPLALHFTLCLCSKDGQVFRDFDPEADFSNAPGMKIQITEKGLEYANEVAGSLMDKELRNLEFPDIFQLSGSTEIRATENRITSLDLPEYKYKLTAPDRFVWSLSYGSLTVAGQWRGRKKLGFIFTKWIPGSGNYEAKANYYDLTIYSRLGVNEEGKPVLEDIQCSLKIRDFSVSLHGNLLSWFLDFFRGPIAKKLRPKVQGQVCKHAKDFVREYINGKLSTFPTQIKLTPDFTLDYRLLFDPYRIIDNHLETLHAGALVIKDDNATDVILPPDLSVSSDSKTDGKMIHIWMSDFILNSILLHAHEKDPPGTVFIIDEEKVPSIGDSLRTSCDQGVPCLGRLFPEVSALFPNSSGRVRIRASDPPVVIFSAGVANFETYGEVDLVVNEVLSGGDNETEADESETQLLSATFQVGADLFFQIEPPTLRVTATCNITWLELQVAETRLSSLADGNLVKDLKELLIPPLEQIANEVLAQGLPIPITDQLELSEPTFKILDRTFELASNLRYKD